MRSTKTVPLLPSSVRVRSASLVWTSAGDPKLLTGSTWTLSNSDEPPMPRSKELLSSQYAYVFWLPSAVLPMLACGGKHLRQFHTLVSNPLRRGQFRWTIQCYISVCSQEEQKGADLWLQHSRRKRRFGVWTSVLVFVTGFVRAIWWCNQVWWLELCWPKQWWSQAQMLVLAARWDHFRHNNDWSDACNDIKQNIYRQAMLQCPGHVPTPCLVHSPQAEFPCPTSRQ